MRNRISETLLRDMLSLHVPERSQLHHRRCADMQARAER